MWTQLAGLISCGLVLTSGSGPDLLTIATTALQQGAAGGDPARVSVEPQPRARWQWPLAGTPEVVHGFDPPGRPWERGHRGVDLAGRDGQPVLAVEAGTVTYSGVIDGVGILTLSHDDGLRSTYQPVRQRLSRGALVERGQPLGTLSVVGTHCANRPCLHWGAVSGKGRYHDPLSLVGRARLVLLPLT